MRAIRSKNSFIKKFKKPNKKTLDYIFNLDATFHIAEGPIRAGKTSDNIIKFCQMIENSPDPVHLTIGQTQSAAKAILWEHEGLGIAHYPDWQARTHVVDGKKVKIRQRIFKGTYEGYDALVLLPKKGSGHPEKYIVAFGGSNKDSHEPYKGWGVGTWIATQYELLHEHTRSELLKRTALSQYRKHVVDLNPTAPGHQIYKDFDRWIANGEVNFVLKLMQDNPIMTPERIAEIIAEYDPESVDFLRDIKGLRVAAGGPIYRVKEANIIKEVNVNDYLTYVIVADPGVNHSATFFGLLAITYDRKHIDLIKEYYHKNSERDGLAIKLPSDYALDYQQFIKECIEMMGKPPEAALSDLDITFIREFERTKYASKLAGINLNSQFLKEEIHDRIKTGINLLWKERLRFSANCPYAILAYRTAIYDEKEKDKGKYVRYDNPKEGTMIDPIDGIEYGITRLRNYWNEWRGDVN